MKRTKKSQKKTKFLLILIVLTAILSITATYAWFSSQREVEISSMRLNVEVAENLEISLDGETWANSIIIDNMRQFYGTYTGTSDDHTIYQAYTDNKNYVPTELLPVSTTGEVANGVLQFMKGEVTNGELKASACSEEGIGEDDIETMEEANDNHPYLVFDLYLKNLSSVTDGDLLRIATGSRVWVDSTTVDTDAGTGVTGTGLENCMRVGLVPYANTLDPTTATGATVRALADGATGKVAIWEPNDLDHITEVVKNSSRSEFSNGTVSSVTVPTYGVLFDSEADGSAAEKYVKIEDVESTSDSKLSVQNTVKPAYATATGTTSPVPLNSTGTDSGATETSVTTGDVKLAMNKITKFRCYVWLEGQDVDCINTASMGSMVQIKLRLDKPQNSNTDLPTYKGGTTPAGG